MPLMQTLLRFPPTPSDSTVTSSTSKPTPELSRSSTASSEVLPLREADDTIVVDTSSVTQLMTPEDSATDISSTSSRAVKLKNVQSGHGRRVIRVSGQDISADCLVESAAAQEDTSKSRTVSGETLVNGSQSSLLRNGIAALDLPWSMTSLLHGSKDDIIMHESLSKSEETLYSESELAREQAKAERTAKIRAKRESNERDRLAKIKAEDDKSTRRSSRLPLLEKAKDVVDLATSALGKRSRDAVERGMDQLGELKRRASTRPKSMLLPSTTSSFEGPTAKKRRVSDSDLATASAEADFKVPRKPLPQSRQKRWLSSGLYTGQDRNFDARLTDSKNKRRTSSKQSPTTKDRTMLPPPMFAGERLLERGRDFKLPFDVFAPLPPGQPKPDEWRKTNKNVFVGDAASFWRIHKYEEHSTCMCTLETGCDDDCQNRYMFYECDDSNCNAGAERCGNRSFEGLRKRCKAGGKYNVGVEVIKTADRGYGVRSNRTFEPNQIIVEYTGEIITQEECEHRMRTTYKENECYYLMLFDQNMIIDATRGSIARFVNHSCEPNCRMEKWTVAGKPRMALFAGDRGIMTGEELTYDYNFDPFSQKNVQECRCGSSNCRGVLGPRPKDERKPKEAKEVVQSALAGAKRKIKEVLDESTSRLNKKQKTNSPASQKSGGKKIIKARASSYSRISLSKVTKKSSPQSLSLSSGRGLAKSPSTLKRLVEAASKNSASKKLGSPKRSASSSSVTGILNRQTSRRSERPLSRRDSVKAAAASVKRNVVRTVKGGASGKERTMRVIED